MGTMAGKRAIVPGTSRGIGRAIAERLAREGASMVVNYAKSTDQAKGVVTAIQADINRIWHVWLLFRERLTQFGQVDILINNAAASFNTPAPFVEVTANVVDAVFARKAYGSFFARQEAAQLLLDCGRIFTSRLGRLVSAWQGSVLTWVARHP